MGVWVVDRCFLVCVCAMCERVSGRWEENICSESRMCLFICTLSRKTYSEIRTVSLRCHSVARLLDSVKSSPLSGTDV